MLIRKCPATMDAASNSNLSNFIEKVDVQSNPATSPGPMGSHTRDTQTIPSTERSIEIRLIETPWKNAKRVRKKD